MLLDELLDAREQRLLQRDVLGDGFDDQLNPGDRLLQRLVHRDAGERRLVAAHLREVAADAPERRVAQGRRRIGERHLMTADGEDLGDAVAHQPGSDDRNLHP